jgi:signal transduction histidine kinase/CheY-like chemotaxis protein/HPt (histidine-containing phosphotransfer) domain-containing protein
MEMKFKLRAKPLSFISLILLLFITIVLGIISNNYIIKSAENNKLLFKGYFFSRMLRELKADVFDIEAKSRGYIITGDSSYLERLGATQVKIQSDLQFLSENHLNEEDLKELKKLNKYVKEKIFFVNEVIKLYNIKGEKGVAQEIKTERGLKIMQNIVQIVDRLSIKERMKHLVDDGNFYVDRVRLLSVMMTVAGVFIALFSLFFIFKDINELNFLHKELKIAKNKVDTSLQIKDQFMTNMSHEIRTPLNAIIGFANQLKKNPPSEKREDYIRTIKHASENLLNIVNDILDFSKIEAGMFRMESIPFSINSLVHSIYAMYFEKAKAKKIKLTLTVDESIPNLVSGDPTRLTQIIVNLLGNAIKFTKNGSIELTVKSINKSTSECCVFFSVKDTGIGISMEKLELIFERFNQGNLTITREYGGTGLGLSIVKSLVELQGGEINVESELGRGSTFGFTLSYKKVDPNLISSKKGIELKNNFNLSLVKILLAEDNEMNQKLAVTILEDLGFDVDVAENGMIAFEMTKQNQYDIILMDLQMPVLDGYRAVHKIRNELKSEIPIIAMTAHVLPGEKEKCIIYGMNDFITKPFNENDLYNLIIKHIPTNVIESSVHELSTDNIKETEMMDGTVIDLTYLKNLKKGSKSFMTEMIDIFIRQNTSDLKNINAAISNSDFVTIKEIAHKMKTSVSFIGLSSKIGNDLNELENLSIENNFNEHFSKHFENIKLICEKAQIELIEYKSTTNLV